MCALQQWEYGFVREIIDMMEEAADVCAYL